MAAKLNFCNLSKRSLFANPVTYCETLVFTCVTWHEFVQVKSLFSVCWNPFPLCMYAWWGYFLSKLSILWGFFCCCCRTPSVGRCSLMKNSCWSFWKIQKFPPLWVFIYFTESDTMTVIIGCSVDCLQVNIYLIVHNWLYFHDLPRGLVRCCAHYSLCCYSVWCFGVGCWEVDHLCQGS